MEVCPTRPKAAQYPGGDRDQLAYCWFEGSFTGFPVPPGAEDTFAYAAFLVDADGIAVPIVASNETTAPNKAPDRVE